MNASVPDEYAAVATAYFAFPGALRDALVAAILEGKKVSTTSLAREYEVEGESFPEVGQRFVVVDSNDRGVALIEVTSVSVAALADVDLAHARDEGEGYSSVAQWRAGHEEFWRSPEVLAALGEETYPLGDETPVVLERFRLVQRLD